jgi:hypothetical protein
MARRYGFCYLCGFGALIRNVAIIQNIVDKTVRCKTAKPLHCSDTLLQFGSCLLLERVSINPLA